MQLFQSDKTELEPAPPPPAPPTAPRKANFSHNLANIKLITKREYKARVLRRNFAIATGAMMFLMFLILLSPVLLQITLFDPTSTDTNRVTLQVIEPEGLLKGQDLTGYLKETLNLSSAANANDSSALTNPKMRYAVTKAGLEESEAVLVKKLRESKFDALIVARRDEDGELNLHYYSGPDTKFWVDSDVQQTLERLVQRDRLQQAGLSSPEIEKLVAPSSKVSTSYLSKPRAGEDTPATQDTAPKDSSQSAELEPLGSASDSSSSRQRVPITNFLGTAMAIMLFASILTYGQMVGQAAAEEKSNRIMELMLSAATPFQLMISKVIGVGLVGLTQLALVGIAAGIAMVLQIPIVLLWASSRIKNSGDSISQLLNSSGVGSGDNIPPDSSALTNQIHMLQLPIVAIALFPLFYMLGYLMWATLFAAAGSLASRQEDVAIALSPIMALCSLNYMIVGFTITGTDATWVTVLSYFPLFTGPMMMARLATGNAYWWEGLISIGLLVASIVVLSWLGARVYRVGVLMYGSKPTFKRFFKLLFGGQ